VHFSADSVPEDIGHKALAVSLSDLAAAGAEPAWMTLALTLPMVDEAWLHDFCEGLFTLAEDYDIELVGGDTTRGPLTITTQLHGFVPHGEALTRSGASAGDLIYVTGTLGDAGLGLRSLQGQVVMADEDQQYCLERLNRPEPRVFEGCQLRGIASACIDISDGLAADLSHILEASGVGAAVNADALPVSDAMLSVYDQYEAVTLAMTAGDDYELCFTVPPDMQDALQTAMAQSECPITRIGVIEAEEGLRCTFEDGEPVDLAQLGYDHCAAI
jgi:thiamine-monophosphate kinase